MLHGLIDGQRAQRVDDGLLVHALPEPLGTTALPRLLDLDAATQAHDVRRGVAAYDALKVQGKRKKAKGKTPLAAQALQRIQLLYRIERKAKGMDDA